MACLEPTIRPFDGVHLNLGRNRSDIPYLVNVQSRRYDNAANRVVIPLMRLPGLAAEPRLAPTFSVKGEQLVLNPLLLFAAPLSALGAVVASLAADGDARLIIGAIDAVITQAHG